MFKIKHFLDGIESDDGLRLWVEPFGVTADLREMCEISQVLSEIGPPRTAWEWFDEHPDGYEYFRAQYHEALARGPYKSGLAELVTLARQQNITLLHQGDDPAHNSATALYEFLAELEAYSTPE